MATTNTEVTNEKVSICTQCCTVQASTAISVTNRCPLAHHPAALANRHPTMSDFPRSWHDQMMILLLHGYQIPALQGQTSCSDHLAGDKLLQKG